MSPAVKHLALNGRSSPVPNSLPNPVPEMVNCRYVTKPLLCCNECVSGISPLLRRILEVDLSGRLVNASGRELSLEGEDSLVPVHNCVEPHVHRSSGSHDTRSVSWAFPTPRTNPRHE